MIKSFNTTSKYALVFAFILIAVLPRYSYAIGGAPTDSGPTGPTSSGGYVCDPAKFSILKLLNSFSTSIISTALTHSDALTKIKTFYSGVGMSPAEAMGCSNYIANNIAPAGCLRNALLAQNCSDTDESVCASLVNQFRVGDGSTGAGFDRKAFAQGKVSGSLLGYVYFVQNTMDYEPVPVNMAYFFKDYYAKIPVIGETAYAQNAVDYGHTLINSILNIWKIFRNIAYALMSIIMLWVGFAIITRRRISSQTVVNVQYALPKIVIALVLIALSYPIGAMITSLAWTLFNNSGEIISSISGTNSAAAVFSTTTCNAAMSMSQMSQVVNNMGVGGMIVLMDIMMTNAAGAGALFEITGFVNLIIIGFMLFVYIKAFWIYFKMVVSTAYSPLTIAFYALPGNDDKLTDWLKQMVAWGAGIFGMRMVLDLVQAFTLDLLSQTFAPFATGTPGVINSVVSSGTLLNVILAPLLLFFGCAVALKIPNTIESMIMGPPKRK